MSLALVCSQSACVKLPLYMLTCKKQFSFALKQAIHIEQLFPSLYSSISILYGMHTYLGFESIHQHHLSVSQTLLTNQDLTARTTTACTIG